MRTEKDISNIESLEDELIAQFLKEMYTHKKKKKKKKIKKKKKKKKKKVNEFT